MIGIKFFPNKLIQSLIKGLPDPKWSKAHNMAYIPHTKQNLSIIFTTFRGISWINYSRFLSNRPVHTANDAVDVTWFRNRETIPEYRLCPEEYLLKLELKRYANNTVKTYVNFFELFINHYKDRELNTINESDIRAYLQKQINRGVSNSYLNQSIKAIKFYYEVVLGMPYMPKLINSRKRIFLSFIYWSLRLILRYSSNLHHECQKYKSISSI